MNKKIPTFLKINLILVGLVLTCNAQPFRELAPPGLFVGSVFHGYGNTWDEPDYQKLALDNFNIMTSSIYMSTVWDSPEKTIDTGPFKKVVDFLSKNNILIHGHAMHYPNIAAVTNWWSKQPLNTVESNMYKYMKAVVSAGGDKVYSWDVLNEVMGDDNNDNDVDGVRRTLYNGTPIIEYKAMGQDYIRAAFRFARSVAPDAKLLLTDYGAEEDSPDNDDEKSDRLYRFVKKLLAEGIPIDGIGFQMHVDSEQGNPNYLAIARNFERFRKLGLLIYITEMDVTSYSTTDPKSVPPAALERAGRFQGRVFSRVLEICMEEPACTSFRFWDFAEYNSRVPNLGGYSWLHPITYDPSFSGVYTYPTPFADINPKKFKPKAAWNSMRSAMKQFVENEGGIYRITSNWRTDNSYIGRVGLLNEQGSYYPSNMAQLFQLDKNSIDWLSLKWRLERVVGTTKVYRIQNLWGQGYLTRAGETDSNGKITPGKGVVVADLNMAWTSQQWIIEYNTDETFTIRCKWSDGNDYVTRRGDQNANGSYDPTSEVSLQSGQNYSSQQWYLVRTL